MFASSHLPQSHVLFASLLLPHALRTIFLLVIFVGIFGGLVMTPGSR
jgi:hypothetical protein